MTEHGKYSGVVDIARNGIDAVIRLENENERLRQEIDGLKAALEAISVAEETLRGELEGADALHEAEKQMHAKTKAKTEDLAMLVKKLVQSMRNGALEPQLADKAMGYLKRNGLEGSPLRMCHE